MRATPKHADSSLKTPVLSVPSERCTKTPTTLPVHVAEALSADPVLAEIVEACAGLSRADLEVVLRYVRGVRDAG